MPKDRHALLGITDAINAIEQYTVSFASADDFYAARINFDAAMMNFIVIGEMVDRISETFKAAHPDIDWKQIKGLRNIIAHDYFGVDAEELWQIIRKQLPALKKNMEKLLALPEKK
ncbi:MAG: HepT-like ribonuclease domain-containing protein [Chitinivibrionales bacterium]